MPHFSRWSKAVLPNLAARPLPSSATAPQVRRLPCVGGCRAPERLGPSGFGRGSTTIVRQIGVIGRMSATAKAGEVDAERQASQIAEVQM